MSYIFTSESVSAGHPDKVCDQISDAVLDAYLTEDPNSRVACETMIKNNMVYIAGEITSTGSPDLEPIVRKTISDIGYDTDDYGFNGETCEFTNLVFEQSPDISQGVTEGEGENLEQGAGDQGLMFGYACTETDSLMPLPIDLSHRLVKKQADVMKEGGLSWLRPDAKSQVSAIYSDDGKTIEGLSAIVLSTQHDEDVTQDDIKEGVMEHIIKPIVPSEWILDSTKIYNWEIEHLDTKHSDLEYIYYIWQAPQKTTYISIFEVQPFGDQIGECIFVGEPQELIKKYSQTKLEQ